MEVPQQTCITKDNAPISVDFLIYWKVVDPERSVLQVGNFAAASQGIATTTLRAVIGDITLDEVLAQRERINNALRSKLDEVTERWGVKITAVEIREIVPPRDVQEAMNRQMSAERNRRALVTEADGKREAAIAMAQGEKEAAILRAEGLKQSAILEAEGLKQSQVLKAEGFALALQTIFNVARQVDSNTMLLQYLEALKALGASPSTKYLPHGVHLACEAPGKHGRKQRPTRVHERNTQRGVSLCRVPYLHVGATLNSTRSTRKSRAGWRATASHCCASGWALCSFGSAH